MTLLDLLTAYEGTSAGLSPSEQVVYFRAALIWNRCHRPEWIAISRTELMLATGIKDAKTIDAARAKLEKRGLVETIPQGRTQPRKWNFKPLEARGTIPLEEGTRGINPLTRGTIPLDTRGIIPLVDEQQTPTKGTIPLDKGNDSLKLGESFPTSQREYTEAFLSASSQHGTTYIDSRRKESNLPELPKEVMDSYQDEIRPICSQFELSKLADDVEQYGKDIVIKAIHRASIRNKRSLAYIEGILKRWSIEGYDEEGGNGVIGRKHQTTEEDDLDKWAEELTRGL